MSRTDWSKQLEHILNCHVSVTVKTQEELNNILLINEQNQQQGNFEALSIGQKFEVERDLWIVAERQDDAYVVIILYDVELSDKEKDLLSWTILQLHAVQKVKQYDGMSSSEKQVTVIGEWLLSQMESDNPASYLPDHFLFSNQLYQEMIPILLVVENSIHYQSSYQELDKLLRSFLDHDIVLIPLRSKEWLIWGPLSLLKDEDSEAFDDQQESVEDSLSNLAYALHEMLTNEWIGECHLAIMPPAVPAKSMVETALSLRETIQLGRKFHVGNYIHLQWMLQLERLLHSIPESMRQKYLEQSLKKAELFVEPEIIATLDVFFDLDCNVSETAKKLYIHRNTLLYRLDKLKQDTGLDVRQFSDAVLVKIILLLYKVTKTI